MRCAVNRDAPEKPGIKTDAVEKPDIMPATLEKPALEPDEYEKASQNRMAFGFSPVSVRFHCHFERFQGHPHQVPFQPRFH